MTRRFAFRSRGPSRLRWFLIGLLFAFAVGAALAQPASSDFELVRSRESRSTYFVKLRKSVRLRMSPMEFLGRYGGLMRIRNPTLTLRQSKVQVDSLGQVHTTYQQRFGDFEVFTGVVKVHQDAEGFILGMNGTYHPIATRMTTKAVVSPQDAAAVASRNHPGSSAVEPSRLVIVDPGWYGDPVRGPRLAYYIVLTAGYANKGPRPAVHKP